MSSQGDVPGFEDLLNSPRSPRSPSSSPKAGRSTFFTEELSNPFADLQSSAVQFVPPSPTSQTSASPRTPVRAASLEPLHSPARSQPNGSPVLEHTRWPPLGSSDVPGPVGDESAPDTLGTAALSPTTPSSTDAPHDRVLVSPIDISHATLPGPAIAQNGIAHKPDPYGEPIEDALSSMSITKPYKVSARDDADSIRTVGLESDQASEHTVQSAMIMPVPLFDGEAKQGIIVSVGDPQKMGSELIASAHTVYTVRTRVLNEGRTPFRKSDFSVLRRFSHFLWLFEQLTSNNPGIIVPAPPEKVVLGRFSSEFVEQRRHALQTCLQRIVNHPMLVSDPDLRLFLESDTFSVDIKHRKTDSGNAGLFASLSSAVVSPKYTEADEYFMARKQLLDSLEPQLRSLHNVLLTASKARAALAASTADVSGAIASVAALSGSLPKPNRDALSALHALKKRAKELEEEQMSYDEGEGGILSTVDAYVRLCSSVRLALQSRLKVYANWQKAMASVQSLRAQHDRARQRGVTPFPEAMHDLGEAERRAEDTKRDFEDVSKLLKAEMVRFDTEKVEDFKITLNRHVEGLVIRQKQIVASWTAYQDVCSRALASNADGPTSDAVVTST